ncbi:MAG: DUF1385 domain-containing protein [Christensenellales bacterium]
MAKLAKTNNKKEKTKYTSIGGQAVLEGVMMLSPEDKMMAIAVRKESGEIVVEKSPREDASKKNKFYSLPVIRGIVRFAATLAMGYKTISFSAKMYGLEEEEPGKFEKWLSEKLGKSAESVVMGLAMLLAAVMAVGLFVLLPSLVAQMAKGFIENRIAVNLIEGLTRMLIFMAYMFAISLMKDIKRVFMYHGAEHKTISCFEAGQPLTTENAMRHSRLHPRCGTSFLLIVMTISILFFSVVGWDYNYLTRILSRLLLMPLVAGISYEALMYMGKYENAFTRALRVPGFWVQRLSTKEPDEKMLEVAIAAFHAASADRYRTEEEKAAMAAQAAIEVEPAVEMASFKNEDILGTAQG